MSGAGGVQLDEYGWRQVHRPGWRPGTGVGGPRVGCHAAGRGRARAKPAPAARVRRSGGRRRPSTPHPWPAPLRRRELTTDVSIGSRSPSARHEAHAERLPHESRTESQSPRQAPVPGCPASSRRPGFDVPSGSNHVDVRPTSSSSRRRDARRLRHNRDRGGISGAGRRRAGCGTSSEPVLGGEKTCARACPTPSRSTASKYPRSAATQVWTAN